MTRLVQLQNGAQRRIALVAEPELRLLAPAFSSIFAIAHAALQRGEKLRDLIAESVGDERLDYDAVYGDNSAWRLLAPIHHPDEPARCLVSGTGLTHLGSAKNRQAMHAASAAETDSMKMFRWGVEGGKPPANKIGVAPEWFYKGNGTILRGHGEPLDLPWYANDGGEEAEIAGVYIVDSAGRPFRVGMAVGNEFSDHVFEKKNYLNLASSKIRTCSLGPELVIDPVFNSVRGTVTIERGGQTFWSQQIATGEAEMCHSLANIEHHHFKFESHRRPGDLHVHYYGAHSLSFGAGVQLSHGDVMVIAFEGFGRALRNPLRAALAPTARVEAFPLA